MSCRLDIAFEYATLILSLYRRSFKKMPHAGLMVEREMEPEESLLLRCRLHIRGGKKGSDRAR